MFFTEQKPPLPPRSRRAAKGGEHHAFFEAFKSSRGLESKRPEITTTMSPRGGENILTTLYDSLEQEPSNVQILELLLEQWKQRGDEGMANGIASSLMQIDPNNEAASRHLSRGVERIRERASSTRHPRPQEVMQVSRSAEEKLKDGYASLLLEAKLLGEEIEAVHTSARVSPDEEVVSTLQAIRDGHVSSVISTPQMVSVRELARKIVKVPKVCQNLIVEDFESLVAWAACQHPPLSPDTIRGRLLKRQALLEAALPESMKKFSVAALTEIEREKLEKTYINSETMLGDKIEDIPKQNFFASEDNYAWDMEELAKAIEINKGVMRNPLSKQLFSTSDIRMILAHPLGQRLKPLQRAQSELKKGVRPETIDRVENLARIMLAEQSVDAGPSREAMDEFLSYVETIPQDEQNAIKSLKIPGRDSHTGQAFDYTIGESVGDAKANTTCFHKVGDFLAQAATYLKSQ